MASRGGGRAAIPEGRHEYEWRPLPRALPARRGPYRNDDRDLSDDGAGLGKRGGNQGNDQRGFWIPYRLEKSDSVSQCIGCGSPPQESRAERFSRTEVRNSGFAPDSGFTLQIAE